MYYTKNVIQTKQQVFRPDNKAESNYARDNVSIKLFLITHRPNDSTLIVYMQVYLPVYLSVFKLTDSTNFAPNFLIFLMKLFMSPSSNFSDSGFMTTPITL